MIENYLKSLILKVCHYSGIRQSFGYLAKTIKFIYRSLFSFTMLDLYHEILLQNISNRNLFQRFIQLYNTFCVCSCYLCRNKPSGNTRNLIS